MNTMCYHLIYIYIYIYDLLYIICEICLNSRGLFFRSKYYTNQTFERNGC